MAKKTAHVPSPRKKKKVVKKKPAAPPPAPEKPSPDEATDVLEDLDATKELPDEPPGDDVPEAATDPAATAEEESRAAAEESTTPPVPTSTTVPATPPLPPPPPAPEGGTFAAGAPGEEPRMWLPDDIESEPDVPQHLMGEPTGPVEKAVEEALAALPVPAEDNGWKEKAALHLGVLLDYGELPVVEFRSLADLGEPHDPKEAKRVLDSFVDQGLVDSSWKASKNRYFLTKQGEVTAKQLRAELG